MELINDFETPARNPFKWNFNCIPSNNTSLSACHLLSQLQTTTTNAFKLIQIHPRPITTDEVIVVAQFTFDP